MRSRLWIGSGEEPDPSPEQGERPETEQWLCLPIAVTGARQRPMPLRSNCIPTKTDRDVFIEQVEVVIGFARCMLAASATGVAAGCSRYLHERPNSYMTGLMHRLNYAIFVPDVAENDLDLFG